MGQGHGAQRQLLISLGDEVFIEAEVAADGKEDALYTLVSVLLQPFREGVAGAGLAVFIEDHEPPPGLEMTNQDTGLESQRPLGVLVASTG
jgi:hypothetical protein